MLNVLRQRSPASILLGLIGAGLVYRGATGHSRLYDRLNINSATGESGIKVKKAVIVNRPNELIAWKTLPSASVQHIGMVRFSPAPGNQGTEVAVMMKYNPPGGVIGDVFAHLLRPITGQQLKEEIRRFKHMMETGETPRTAGQPSGRELEQSPAREAAMA